MTEGRFATIAELVAGVDAGSLNEYVYHLKTGGEVRLGFPGAKSQTLTLTDGAQIAQAKDFVEVARLYSAGWELGSPGRAGVRVHFRKPLELEPEVDSAPAATAAGEEE